MSAPLPRRVSVVVPTCDRPAMLRQALASIRALEGPDLSFEILVGDNGKAPETREVADEFGAVHIPVAQKGASAARNAGLRAANGEFIAFLDDDDVWLADHIRPHLARLDAEPALEGLIGQVIYTDHQLVPTGNPFPEIEPGEGDELLRRMLSGYFPQIGTLVVRRGVRELVGEFDLVLLGGQDLDWMLRIARRRVLGFQKTACILFRGRPPGSYDALQHRRIAFDRKVFLRHATPEWRIWPSAIGFFRAYSGTMRHFYIYFSEAAEVRAKRGLRREAFKAMRIAAGVLPVRALVHVFTPSPMQRALKAVFSKSVSPPSRMQAVPRDSERS
ncbi:glycosyltransferase family 2 protein [Phenylobacterium sp.]|uniref:glycosyltransferase family 2 protein n=1 Tax=Phenylobacterium sp. TaxID=1871053 RepID=UPI0035B48ACA